MGSITQSPDRVAQAVSGSGVALGAVDSALQRADSNPGQLVEQAFTGISAAEIVHENRQQLSSLSEGVASAGHPPHLVADRMDEFVPAGVFEPPASAAAGYEGETSGGIDADAAGGSNGYGGDLAETRNVPANLNSAGIHSFAHRITPERRGMVPANSPMDCQANAAILMGPSPSGKRKSCSGASDVPFEPKRAEGLNRVPSDVAMVIGLSDGEAGEPFETALRKPLDACDSNIAGILAGVAAAPTVNEGDTAQMQGLHPIDFAGTTDADIIAWENKIREEEVLNVPLVGSIESLDALEAEYSAGSRVFVAKIGALRGRYTFIRRTRGDGNCFFRSFVFGYLENILGTNDFKERDRAIERLTGLKSRLLEAGYDELVLESPLELLLGMLRSIGSLTDPLTLEALESNMRADDVSNYVVFLLRMVTSAEVKMRSDFFAPFIMGLAEMEVDVFCQKCIDPMGEESDHVQMVALTDALQVPIRVVYLDRSMAPTIGGDGGTENADVVGGSFTSATVGGSASIAATVTSGTGMEPGYIKFDTHDFIPEALEGYAQEPRVHLLYRPGHYDLLYAKP